MLNPCVLVSLAEGVKSGDELRSRLRGLACALNLIAEILGRKDSPASVTTVSGGTAELLS